MHLMLNKTIKISFEIPTNAHQFQKYTFKLFLKILIISYKLIIVV